MKRYPSDRSRLRRHDLVVVAGIGVGNAAAARRDAVKAALIERIQKRYQGARLLYLLRIEQLLAAAELASRNVALHARDHHRDNGKRLGYAGDLRDHSRFHDLRLDLIKARCEITPGVIRDQNSGRTHEWVDDIARPQCELLNATTDA